MAFLDATELPADFEVAADLCIIGGGAAGLTLASEFDGTRFSVCVIESGGLAPDEQVQLLHDLEASGDPLRENYMSRARYFGGSCNLWAGRSMLLGELDLQQRDWVPGSGWPIALSDIADFYPRAGRLLDLPALDSSAMQRYRSMLTPEEGKLFADGTLTPTTSLWARGSKRFGKDFRSQMRRSPNVRVLLNASVTRILLNEAGDAVSGIDVRTLGGGAPMVRAARYILACGGIENARLLLASNDRHRQGIGNDHDLVGRCFMDHPRAVYGKVHVPAGVRLRALRGRPLPDGKVQIGIGLSESTQRRERLLNHYVTFEAQTSGYAEARYQAMVQTAKVLLRRGHAGSRWDLRSMRVRDLPEMMYLLSPKELMPHALYRAWVAARDAIPRAPAPQTFIVVYFCEQPPDARSRVTLSTQRDALGMARAHLHWHIGDAVRDSILKMQLLLQQQLERTGIGRLEAGQGEMSFTDASHHMGTTRIGRHPRDGVVDVDGRVHGVDNLYIAGSSVFPAAGYANPTITIVALAMRMADHLKAQSDA